MSDPDGTRGVQNSDHKRNAFFTPLHRNDVFSQQLQNTPSNNYAYTYSYPCKNRINRSTTKLDTNHPKSLSSFQQNEFQINQQYYKDTEKNH